MWQKGKPGVGGERPNGIAGCRLTWDSERVIVAKNPGNAEGAKDPYFRQATDETKER